MHSIEPNPTHTRGSQIISDNALEPEYFLNVHLERHTWFRTANDHPIVTTVGAIAVTQEAYQIYL